MREASLAEELEVAGACWAHFRQEYAWPLKKPFAREHPQWAEQVLHPEKKRWVHIQVNPNVTPDWEVLFQLPEVRDLLEPLPRLIHEVATRVEASPIYNNDQESRQAVTLADFQRFWSSAEAAELAVALLRSQWTPWFGWGNRDPRDAPFHPPLQVLFFEAAKVPDDLLRLHRQWDDSTAKITQPQGAHLELLRRVHGHLKEQRAWPEAVLFAVKHRQGIGNIPKLVDSLEPQFIRGQWRGERSHRIKLTRASLPLVSTTQERDLLAQAIRAMAQLVMGTDEPTLDISAQRVAHELLVPEEKVAPLLRYLEQEHWVSFEPPDYREPWTLTVTDRLLDFKTVESWEDYERSHQQYREEQQRKLGALVSQGFVARQTMFGIPAIPSEEDKKVRSKGARKQRRLFISHAEKDKEIVDAFVDLLELGMGVRHEDIVCTSRVPQSIPVGAEFRGYLRDAVNDSTLFICLVSQNFYASKFALCELGAAWGAKKAIIPVLVPPLGLKSLEAVLEGLQGVDLLNGDQLARLYEEVCERLKINVDVGRWTQRVRKFLQQAQEILE